MSERFERGADVLRQIGTVASFGRDRWPNLPAEQAEDVSRILTEFCFGDVWGRPGTPLDLKTRRLLTIAIVASLGRERQLRGHITGALQQGISQEEIVDTLVHVIPYAGFPAGLTGLEIANDVFGARKTG